MNLVLIALYLVLLATQPQAAKPAQAVESRSDVDTLATSDPAAIAISPDGQKIVFSVASEGRFELWVHSLNSGTSRRLPGIDDAANAFPCWAPDSKSIAFFGRTEFRRIEIETGVIQKLVDAPNGRGCTWNREGIILFGIGGNVGFSIFRIPEHGGPPQPATPRSPVNVYCPYFLPDGRHFLYFAVGDGIYVGELNGPQPKKLLTSDSGAVYSPTGHVLFVRKDTLFAQKFDADSAMLSGEPFAVAQPVPVDIFEPAVSASATGDLIYRIGKGSSDLRQLKWFDRSGKELGVVTDGGVASSPPKISADGRLLAVDRVVNGNTDIYLIEVESGKLNQFTTPPGAHLYPVLSPDARTLYFGSNQAGPVELYEKAVAGDTPEKLVMPNRATRLPREISSDGRFLLFRGGSRDIWALQLDGNPRGEFPVVETPGLDDWPKFSPDARWISFQSDESGRREIYVQPFPSGPRTRISPNGGVYPFWGAGGKEIVYIGPGNQFDAVPIEIDESTQTVKAGTPSVLFTPAILNNVADGVSGPPFFVMPDGQRFLISAMSYARTPIKVIKNWQGKP
jgi:Tol biopolymer transport system component